MSEAKRQDGQLNSIEEEEGTSDDEADESSSYTQSQSQGIKEYSLGHSKMKKRSFFYNLPVYSYK